MNRIRVELVLLSPRKKAASAAKRCIEDSAVWRLCVTVLYGYIAEYDLSWMVLTGRVTCQEALNFPAQLDPSRDDVSTTWIPFVDPEADLSELTAQCMGKLHIAMRPVTQALALKGPITVVWAGDADLNNTFISAWRAYLRADPDYPSTPRHEKTMEAACRSAGVRTGAYVALRQELTETVFHGLPPKGL